MRIMLFHGEQSITDLADNIYACLSSKTHAVAEAALLKANPELKEIGSLKPGAILKVPMISGISFKADRNHADPIEQVGAALIRSLESYRSQLVDAVTEEGKKLDDEARLLEDTEFKRQIEGEDEGELRALCAAARHGLVGRAKKLKNFKNAMSGVVDQLAGELGKFSR